MKVICFPWDRRNNGFNKALYKQSFKFFSQHLFESKIRLSIKTRFHVHIGTVKFATQFKESPCSQVATVPSFGSGENGVQLPKGDSFFLFIFVLNSI